MSGVPGGPSKLADLSLDHGIQLVARGRDLLIQPPPRRGIALHVGEPRHRLLARNPRDVLQGGDHVYASNLHPSSSRAFCRARSAIFCRRPRVAASTVARTLRSREHAAGSSLSPARNMPISSSTISMQDSVS